MKNTIKAATLAALGAFAVTGSAGATQIFSTGYDTPNGNGNANSGTYNYWDKSYTGAGSVTTDSAYLSGGSGDLTDGAVASNFWYNVENSAGTGPYVGWRGTGALNPTVTFHFAGGSVINTIGVHMDNSHAGGVYAPQAILVNGVSHAFTSPAPGSIGWGYISGLNLTGPSHTVQFQQITTGAWVFVSEVSFDGRAVPEPATWGLMILGFGAAGSMLRRRRVTA